MANSNFTKRQLGVSKLQFFGNRLLQYLGAPLSTSLAKSIQMDTGVTVARGFSIPVEQVIAGPGNETYTQGIAAASNTAIKNAFALTTAVQTVTTFVAQPDCARTLRVVSTAGCGDGGFTGANARIVKITGTNWRGETITEWVPLNATTAVDTKKAFLTVTSVIMPVEGDGSDTVSIGYALDFPFERPPLAATDVLEFGRKAAVATAYTLEALPTLAVVKGYAPIATAAITSTQTTIVINTIVGTISAGAQRTHARIMFPDGTYEEIIITDRTSQTLTVVRGANGTTAKEAPVGLIITTAIPDTVTFATTITAEDRLRISYRTQVV